MCTYLVYLDDGARFKCLDGSPGFVDPDIAVVAKTHWLQRVSTDQAPHPSHFTD